MKKAALAAAVASVALLLAGAALWPGQGIFSAGDRGQNAAASGPQISGEHASMRGTPIATRSGGQAASGPVDHFLAPGLRFQLEALWLEAGEVGDPATLKQRLLALVPRHFSANDAVRAAQLLERYVDYRVALSGLKPPADWSDPHALRQALEARQKVRARHFTPEEHDALFAQEEELDRYTLARIEIERNTQLGAAQKDTALRDAERQLGAEHRAVRAEAVQHIAAAAQTASLDAQGAGDVERHAQRRALYGDAAAHNLAQLDREEREWQGRLSEYAAARQSQSQPQLEATRQRLFTPQEQLRLDAALALRGPGAASR
ncbi:lipase chaperone [Caenimonas sedimenti]|uniref:Lipase helper protein n=1 Tax=Caenimonas sedimenti TaxID=2596921 RepID=A0A562ZR21_9BURK|nr:lipase chaperone [Caenimonas sedimenti]TWO70745.1 lipase chaperone [Caenimonas sedimenti]